MSDNPESVNGKSLSPAEIEKTLENVREQLTASVDELVESVRPANQIKTIKVRVKKYGDDILERIRSTCEEARQGDREAIITLVGAAAGIVGFVGICICRMRPKKHR